MKHLSAGVFLFLTLGSSWGQSLKSPRSRVLLQDAGLKELVYGKKLNQFTSCATVDGITWKYKDDGRQTRVLIRDTLRMNAETEFYNWEISQIMDKDGFSTYVFRRALKKNKSEAWVVKDYKLNRILDSEYGPHVVKTQDIRNLINKAAFTFTAADGGTVVYTPGAFKSSVLAMTPARGEFGQATSPVYIKNMICFRPEEKYEFIKTKDDGKADSTPGLGSASAPAVRAAPGK